MPIYKVIPQKKVYLKKQNIMILRILDETLRSHLPQGTEGTRRPELAPSEIRSNSRATNTVVRLLGFLLNRELDSEYSVLNALEFSIDPTADILRMEYVGYLNGLLKHIKKFAKHTESEKIDSSYVLVREILLRLVSIALSSDMNPSRDGVVMVGILETFVERIFVVPEILKDDTILPKLFRDVPMFINHLGTETKVWNNRIKQMVKINVIMRSPSNIFSKSMGHLTKIKNIAERQLCAKLDSKLEVHSLAESWLNAKDGTLVRCENRLIKGRSAVSFRERQTLIINAFKDKQKKDSVRKLYGVLNATNELLEVTQNLDAIITASGWVFFLMGVFRVEVLSEKIKKHWKMCDEVLNLEAADPILQGSIGVGIRQYQAQSNVAYPDCLQDESYQGLVVLQDEKMIRSLLNILAQKVQFLVSLQNKYQLEGLVNTSGMSLSTSLPSSYATISQGLPMIEDQEDKDDSQNSNDATKNEGEGVELLDISSKPSDEGSDEREDVSPEAKREQTTCNKIARFIKTFACCAPRGTANSPAIEERPQEQHKDEIEGSDMRL